MVQEFKNDIYPRKLWIATSWESVEDKFKSYGNYVLEKSKTAWAATYPQVTNKETGDYGVLIVFHDYMELGGSKIVENIAHESLHATNAIFNDLGIEYGLMHDEHAAYMVGWVANCCWQVLQKEVYKNAEETKQ